MLCLLLLFLCIRWIQGEGILKPAPPTNTAGNENVAATQQSRSQNTVSFYVMGDGPYGSKGRERFPDQLQRLTSRPEFVIHVGDVHERQKECNLALYDRAADDFLQHVHVPTFVLPGDADWYECNDKAESWNKWSSRFIMFHKNWSHSLDVRHQVERPENFAFTHKGVLFVGFHVLDATVDDWDPWNEQVHDDTVWLNQQLDTHAYGDDVGAVVLLCHAYAHPRRYKEFYEALMRHAKALDNPILYIHGDTHNFLVDRRFPASNILRVVLDTTRESDPTEVTVNAFGAVPFKLNRRPLVK